MTFLRDCGRETLPQFRLPQIYNLSSRIFISHEFTLSTYSRMLRRPVTWDFLWKDSQNVETTQNVAIPALWDCPSVAQVRTLGGSRGPLFLVTLGWATTGACERRFGAGEPAGPARPGTFRSGSGSKQP